MSPVETVAQVFDEIQRAKAGATAYCTNFFPVQNRLQAWIEHKELHAVLRDHTTFFLRSDRGFWHLYFCSPSPSALEQALSGLPELNQERLVSDVVGQEAALSGMVDLMERVGFKPQTRLVRLARPGKPVDPPAVPTAPVDWAERGDAPGVMALLESSFDPFADSLPTPYELEAAIAARQVLLIRHSGAVGALLFFETQGLTSMVRYWVVADQCRSAGFGSAVIRHYFSAHNAVRRFILWVAASNEGAILKYRHYGYGPDGLLDQIFVNHVIRA